MLAEKIIDWKRYIHGILGNRFCNAWISNPVVQKIITNRFGVIITGILVRSHVYFSCWRTDDCQLGPNQGNREAKKQQQPLAPSTCTGILYRWNVVTYRCLIFLAIRNCLSKLAWCSILKIGKNNAFRILKTEVIIFPSKRVRKAVPLHWLSLCFWLNVMITTLNLD